MKQLMRRNKKIYSLIVLLSIFVITFTLSIYNPIIKFLESDFQQELHLSSEKQNVEQWLKNSEFTSHEYWYSIKNGDESDVKALISNEHANFKVRGDSGIFNLIGNQFNALDWKNSTNPELPVLPDNHSIDEGDIIIQHDWDGPSEELQNNPSIHFKENITMPVNMSDYIITSASIQAVVNATVTVSPVNPGIEVFGDNCPQYLIGDYVRFYILISDIDNLYSYSIAEYKTINLGQDGPPEIDKLNDTYLIPVPEEILISYLTLILKIDNFNFTITLGLDIYCEDNSVGSDRDYWNDLRFKNLNFTFAYKKKIDQFTSVSWNQDGKKISDYSDNYIVVEKATLSFKYKIDKPWSKSSPNSEIRILVNSVPHTETIKLLNANNTFQNLKFGGFNIKSLINKLKNANLSIQIYLADEFELNQIITISLIEVTLYIKYIEIFAEKPGIDWSWLVYTLIGAIVGLITVFYFISGSF